MFVSRWLEQRLGDAPVGIRSDANFVHSSMLAPPGDAGIMNLHQQRRRGYL